MNEPHGGPPTSRPFSRSFKTIFSAVRKPHLSRSLDQSQKIITWHLCSAYMCNSMQIYGRIEQLCFHKHWILAFSYRIMVDHQIIDPANCLLSSRWPWWFCNKHQPLISSEVMWHKRTLTVLRTCQMLCMWFLRLRMNLTHINSASHTCRMSPASPWVSMSKYDLSCATAGSYPTETFPSQAWYLVACIDVQCKYPVIAIVQPCLKEDQ